MQKLIDGLRHFQDHVFWERQEQFERCIETQNPQALLITCSDSRVLPETILEADPGDLFVARNAGNLVPPPGTNGGEAATINYAVESLGVTDVIVCGHYRCGAVKALLDGKLSPEGGPVGAWLQHAGETLEAMERDFSQLEGQERWDRAVEENVLVQMDHLSKHTAVAARLAAGTLRIHAWVLRFESSEILAYDPQQEKFEPIDAREIVRPALPLRPSEAQEIELPKVERPKAPEPKSSSRRWLRTIVDDLPASLVVFAVALPLCVAIAKACGVPSAAGIITAIIGGIVVGLFGGGPLQVSGPTAGLIVVLVSLDGKIGLTSLGLIVLLAGAIQVLAGLLRFGQWFRAVSPAVILGMLAGIGLVLIAQQFHVTLDDRPDANALMNYFGIPRAVVDIFDGHEGHDGHTSAALIGLLTIGVLVFWKRAVPKQLQKIPAVLAAVVVASVTAMAFDLPVQRVEFSGLASGVNLLDLSSVPALLGDSTVWQVAFTIAFLASAETLLTAAAADRMHTGPRTRYDRELTAQGFGNAVCGVLGTLPMAGVIVRTAANIEAGAKSRWSTIFHGVWMLAFVLLVPGLLRVIPLAAMAATLVLTGFRLIQFGEIRKLWTENRGEGLICVAVAAAIVGIDLLSGIILGVALSVVKLVYTFSRLRVRRQSDASGNRITLTLEGVGTFLRLPKLAAALEAVPAGAEVRLDCKRLSYIDHTCLTMLMSWEKQHQATGGKLILDWEVLKSRFHAGLPRARACKH